MAAGRGKTGADTQACTLCAMHNTPQLKQGNQRNMMQHLNGAPSSMLPDSSQRRFGHHRSRYMLPGPLPSAKACDHSLEARSTSAHRRDLGVQLPTSLLCSLLDRVRCCSRCFGRSRAARGFPRSEGAAKRALLRLLRLYRRGLPHMRPKRMGCLIRSPPPIWNKATCRISATCQSYSPRASKQKNTESFV